MPRFPYSKQSIDSADIAAVTSVLRGDWLTCGPTIERYEKALAGVTGAAHCVATANGTAALHLAYAALGLGEGDELITSPITFSATANAARLLGAEVVFADVDPSTGNITAKSIAEKITAKTRGIAAVHFGGLPINLGRVSELARERGLWLVEDACHALGAAYELSTIGDCQYSDAVVFSTHAIKNITTGEGGAICARSRNVDRVCRLLRSHGIDKQAGNAEEPWSYDMVALGWNYRITDIQCALGLSQLGHLAEWIERREHLASIYREELQRRFGDAVSMQPELDDRRSGWHLLSTQVDFARFGIERPALVAALRERGIGCQVHYIPVYRLSYYRDRYGDQITLPGAEQFYARQLSLPFFVDMSDADIGVVTDELERLLTARKDHGASIGNA